MTVKAMHSFSPVHSHVPDWYLFLCVQTDQQNSWLLHGVIIFRDAHSNNYWNWTFCCFQVMVLVCLLKKVVCFFWQILFKKNSIRYPKKVSWLFPNCLTSRFYQLAWVKRLFQQLYEFCLIFKRSPRKRKRKKMEKQKKTQEKYPRRKHRKHAWKFWK